MPTLASGPLAILRVVYIKSKILIMKKFINIKTLLLLSAATIIVLLISFFKTKRTDLPNIIKTSPLANSQGVLFDSPIYFYLDKPIELSNLKITSSPEEAWEPALDKDNVLTLKHSKYFQVDTEYTINLALGDEPLYSLNFKTIFQQSDPRYAQEVNAQMTRDYPFATIFPYRTERFSALYKSPLVIEITINGSSIPSSQALKEVKDYITNKGLDPNSHTFVFSVPTP